MVRHAGNERGPLAKLIRDARVRNNWTQERLADESGVSRSTLIRWEKGEITAPSREQLSAAASALGIPVEDAFRSIGWLETSADPEGSLAPTALDIEEIVDFSPQPGSHAMRVAAEAAREQRETLGLSLEAMARQADVSVRSIRRLESGERWPSATDRARIEIFGLRWPSGQLATIAARADSAARPPEDLIAELMAEATEQMLAGKPDVAEPIVERALDVARRVASTRRTA